MKKPEQLGKLSGWVCNGWRLVVKSHQGWLSIQLFQPAVLMRARRPGAGALSPNRHPNVNPPLDCPVSARENWGLAVPARKKSRKPGKAMDRLWATTLKESWGLVEARSLGHDVPNRQHTRSETVHRPLSFYALSWEGGSVRKRIDLRRLL